MNKNAFTLTEMLGVIVILSVIALVAIPALTASQGKSDAAYYESLKNLVAIAGKDYFSDHRNLLPANNGSTNVVNLDTLTKLDYIEQPVSTKKNACIGYVEVTKSERFNYLTCLKCDDYISDSRCNFENDGGGSAVADEYLTVSPTYFEVSYGDPFNPPYAQYYSNGELVRSDIGANPAYIDTNVLTTYTLNYYYRNAEPVSIQVKVIDDIPPSKVNVVMRKDSATGVIYTSGWTNSNVFQIFSATDNESGIKGYEYSFENQPNNKAVWTFTESNTITQLDLIKKLGSSSKDIDKTVYVRAVDNVENRGPITSYRVSVDQTNPMADFDIKGTLGENNWYTSNVTIGVKNQSDGAGSGVASATVSTNQITSNTNTTGQKVTLTVKDKAGNVATKDQYIKVDKTVPTVGNIVLSGTAGTNGWYISDVKVSASGGSAGPSGFTNKLSHTIINYETKGVTVTLTIKAGNGLSNSTTKVVKVDKSAPSTPTSNGMSKGSVNAGSGSADNISGVSQYLYCKRTDNVTPSSNDSCFNSDRNFSTACGKTWKGYVVAVNGAGLRSAVKSHGSLYTGDCCSLPALGSRCSYEGQTTTCGQTYYCRRRVTRHEAYWYLYSGTPTGSGGASYGVGYCTMNGDRWNLGGHVNTAYKSYRADINGDKLYQYGLDYYINQYSYMCHYVHEEVLEWQNW